MILYQHQIVRADLKANHAALYVFGDNVQRIGLGGQAREMRGEPNAVGIPTKRSPHVYFRDDDYDEAVASMQTAFNRLANHLLLAGGVIVFPALGIGTGLANLPSQAPKIWNYLNAKLHALGITNHG